MKHKRYDRISHVRMLRGIIASLLFCIALLLVAVFETGKQVEEMQEQLTEMTAAVTMMREAE